MSAGALALAVSGLFGGLTAVEPEKVPTIALETVNPGKPWNVTVIWAKYTKDASPLKLQKPGDRWLVVKATVEITSDESRTDMRDVLRLRGVPGLIGRSDDAGAQPDVVYLGAEGYVRDLHPGLPETLLFFWEQAGDAELPKDVEIAVIGKTHRRDSLTGHLQWLDPEPRALVRTQLVDADA